MVSNGTGAARRMRIETWPLDLAIRKSLRTFERIISRD